MRAVILGPHPLNGTISTTNYFNFYASRLPASLPGWQVEAGCPGNMERKDSGNVGRAIIRYENFISWPIRLRGIRADLVHISDQGLAWYVPFLKRTRRLTTVHDLIAYMTMKGLLQFGESTARRRMLVSECVRHIKTSDHIVSSSECTAGHLVSLLDIPASRITVVPCMLESDLSPLSPEERRSARTRWFGNAEYVVIHVGKATSYKNRIGALRAFDQLQRGLPTAQMFLVHGSPNQEEAAFLRACEKRDSIHFLPPITRSELRQFYGAADVLIFPSLYEGFGWPPLEAMACGCPVVCTTRGSLKEVVADCAFTVEDPHDHSSLANAMRIILLEAASARDFQTRGLKRVKLFAPDEILGQMAQVYRSTCGGTP